MKHSVLHYETETALKISIVLGFSILTLIMIIGRQEMFLEMPRETFCAIVFKK